MNLDRNQRIREGRTVVLMVSAVLLMLGTVLVLPSVGGIILGLGIGIFVLTFSGPFV